MAAEQATVQVREAASNQQVAIQALQQELAMVQAEANTAQAQVTTTVGLETVIQELQVSLPFDCAATQSCGSAQTQAALPLSVLFIPGNVENVKLNEKSR